MRWTPRPLVDPGAVSQLTAEVTKDDLLSALLVQRGIQSFEEAKSFFRPDLRHLHNPYRMKDMERAVERIEKARLGQESVMIYGDYDVDGTTSVALMSEFLLLCIRNKTLTKRKTVICRTREKNGNE